MPFYMHSVYSKDAWTLALKETSMRPPSFSVLLEPKASKIEKRDTGVGKDLSFPIN